jgi:hypothetical protein
MALNGELAIALAEAAEQEKRLRQRGKTPVTMAPTTERGSHAGACDGGTGSG